MIDHVRASIIEYLAGRFDADDLATRLPDGWELDENGTPEARTLTLRSIGYLAEYQRGDRSNDDLWRALSHLVREPDAPSIGTKTPVQSVPEVAMTQTPASKSPQAAPALVTA
jgi:hypothetical protein